MAVNEKHKDFPAYKKEVDALRAKMDAELDNLPAPMPHSGYGEGDMVMIHKKYYKQLKELKDKYKHLFK